MDFPGPSTTSSNSTHEYLSKRKENLCSHKSLCMNLCSSFIYDHPKLETNQVSSSWWGGDPWGPSTRCRKRKGLSVCPAGVKFQCLFCGKDTRPKRLYNSLHVTFWKRQIEREGARSVVARGWGSGRDCLPRAAGGNWGWWSSSVASGGYTTVCICQNLQARTLQSESYCIYI